MASVSPLALALAEESLEASMVTPLSESRKVGPLPERRAAVMAMIVRTSSSECSISSEAVSCDSGAKG